MRVHRRANKTISIVLRFLLRGIDVWVDCPCGARVCGFYTGKFDKTIDASLSRRITTTGVQQ